jgi:predicted phage tail protein
MAVSSAAEAVRALCSQIKGFEAYMAQSKDRGEAYAVFYGKTNLSKDELKNPVGPRDIRIAPVLIGSKQQGIFQIIVGIVLIIVGVVGEFATAGTSTQLILMGASMIFGGVVQLLAPHPKGSAAGDMAENQPNYSFNGPINTQAQGASIPLLYGRMIVGSAVASAGIDTLMGDYVPKTLNPLGYGGGGGGAATRWNEDFLGI